MSRRTIAISIALVVASLVGTTTAAPPAAADPPTNGKIAYLGGTFTPSEQELGLWTVNPDGTGATRIVTGSMDPEVLDPMAFDWSPNGSRIAYTVCCEPRDDGHPGSWAPQRVEIVNADGTGRVERGIPGPWRPATSQRPEVHWSPDGSRIGLPIEVPASGPGTTTNAGLAIVPVDGSPPAVVDASFGISVDRIGHLEWSPDGSTLAFSVGQYGDLVATVRADGTNLTTVADYRDPPFELSVGGPTWLSNSRLVVGARSRRTEMGYATGSIWAIDSDGTDPTPLLADTGLYEFEMYVWPGYPESRVSPDKSRFAFEGGGIGETTPGGEPLRSGLWVANSDGSGARNVATREGYRYPSECFDWSPDSRYVTWVWGSYASPWSKLVVRRADASSLATTVIEPGMVGCPKWAPAPAASSQDHVSVRVTGKYNYNASADLSGGNLEVALSGGSINVVGGTGTYPGTNGGTATIGVNARRFWILPMYLGNVTVNDAGAGLAVSYPLFFNRIGRTPTGATFTASWFDTRGTFGGYTATVTIDDIT